MTTHYPRSTQSLTLGLHLQETQSGPIMLSESLEGVYVYPFFAKKLRRLLTPSEYIRKFAEALAQTIGHAPGALALLHLQSPNLLPHLR